MAALERAILGKGVAGERCTFGAFDHLDAYCRRVRGGDACRAQHRVLAEHFVVDLGDQIVLAIGVAAPDLPELDGTYGHDSFPECSEVVSRLTGRMVGVNRPRGYRGLC